LAWRRGVFGTAPLPRQVHEHPFSVEKTDPKSVNCFLVAKKL